MINRIKKILAIALVACSMFALTACKDVDVMLTTGLSTDEVFRIEGERVGNTEFMLCLTNIANQYEKVYGKELWELQTQEGTTMAEKCKLLVLAQLSQVKAMKLLAAEKEVSLTQEEQSAVQAATGKYLASLTAQEKEALGLTEGNLVEQIYTEKLLADKLYGYLIRDVNPEISDEEARMITVQHILLKTYTLDENGNRKELDESAKGSLLQKAEEIHAIATSGEDFDALISKYSEDSKAAYSFCKGQMEAELEEVAFALANGEISSVVQTSQGYHIIKCISTLEREQTDLNKEKLLLERKQEVFGATYNAYVEQLDKRVNTKVWDTLALADSSISDTTELYSIYESELGALFQ